jgi:hypothetical protein
MHEPYRLTLHTSMQREDWQELVSFLANFPTLTPELLALAVREARMEVRPHLLDFKDAWHLAGMTPAEVLGLHCLAPARMASHGLLFPMHPAYVVQENDMTPITSLALPLPLLRARCGRVPPPCVRRAELADAANAAAARAAQTVHAAGALQVTPAHLTMLYDLYPGAPRTLAGVNAWIAEAGCHFVEVPCYTHFPAMPALPLRLGSVMQPLLVEHLAVKYMAPAHASLALKLRVLYKLQHNATFSFPWPTDRLDVTEDAVSLTPFADMPAEDVVCWGTLGSQTYITCDALAEWFATRRCLDRFDETGAAYNIAQARALVDVLTAYILRLEHGEVARAAEVKSASLRRARALRHTVEGLIDAHLRSLAMDRALVCSMAQLGEEARAAVLAFFRAVQEMAAYCFHWRGPGQPFPRMGDTVVHLSDDMDVETAVYTRGMPPVIDTYMAIPHTLREQVGALRVFIQPSEPSAQTIAQTLAVMQDPSGVGARQCIRLSARPLWQTACAYSELFFNEALPQYELAV